MVMRSKKRSHQPMTLHNNTHTERIHLRYIARISKQNERGRTYDHGYNSENDQVCLKR